MTTKKIETIGSAPRLPNWPTAVSAMRRGEEPLIVLAHLLSVPVEGGETELQASVLNELAAQRSPAISIYDRKYTAHIYPEPDVTDGQVYEAMRDYASQHATEDPAMREVKRNEIVRMVSEWRHGGPPAAADDAYWRNFDATLAKARERG